VLFAVLDRGEARDAVHDPTWPRTWLTRARTVLFAIVLARREPVPRSAQVWTHITVVSLFANAVPDLLFAAAEQRVNSSTAGAINPTTPLWTVVPDGLAIWHKKR
jgi:drug/metabolite transporter (DMT)-like permease